MKKKSGLITIDFETYYDRLYSLSKITTEEYVRSDSFEVIGVAVKVNNEPAQWASGTHTQIYHWLHSNFDWADSLVLAHNAMFDGSILGWRFDIHPRGWLDTMCMARALHGVESSASLKALAERYGLGVKGTEVLAALGKRRSDFTPEELSRYGDYCINDVELTYALFRQMSRVFPKQEYKVIDITLRMFIEPLLELDIDLLQKHLADTQERKAALLRSINEMSLPGMTPEMGEPQDVLMSNPKFAAVLRALGVEPPTKISLTTGKETLALAKNDEEFRALEEHPDERVQTLVAVRLGTKSTLEETRTQRFIDIAKRGPLPGPIRYYAAHTGRWGGDDKINLQNLPSRGKNANQLKKSIIAPKGHVIIDADSAQIEARVLSWLAGQEDLVEVFRKNNEEIAAGIPKKEFQYDPYKLMASMIYGVPSSQIDDDKRFIGKSVVLGAGYGMGAAKFQKQLKGMGKDIELDEARRIIDVYRRSNNQIVGLWREAQNVLACMSRGDPATLGQHGVLEVLHQSSAIRLPSGLLQRYEELRYAETANGVEYSYKTRKGRTKIYGGKLVENVCQGIARCIIAEQMIRISKKYKVVLTVHDSIACVVREEDAQEAADYMEQSMRWVPKWAEGLPVNCEYGMGKSYGDC